MNIRIGETHWRAKLTDHDVELIRMLLLERRMLIALHRGQGAGQGAIEKVLRQSGLSFSAIAVKFEIGKSTVRDIAVQRRRIG